MHLKRKGIFAINISMIVTLLAALIVRSPGVYATPAAQETEEKGTVIVGSQEATSTQILAAISTLLLQEMGYEVVPVTTENVGVPADLFWLETRTSTTSFGDISGIFPIVGTESPAAAADIDAVLQTISTNLNTQTIEELQAQVETGQDEVTESGDELSPDVAAQELLRSLGLIRPESKGEIAIGSWEWTPPLIVTEITRQVLENAGYEVTFVQDEFVRDGVTSGTVDLYWDYTGSGITLWHGIPSRGVPQDPELVWEMIGELDGLHHDLTWLRPSSIDEAWVLMVKPELYEAGMTTIDDLADHVRSNGADSLVLCVEDDFYSSTTDGLPALFRFYDFELAESNINVVSYDELYEGLRAGECDVAEAFPDDGRLLVWNLPTLEDTRNFFVPFNLAPVIRNDTLAQHPELQGLLEQISTLIDVPTIQQLSALVDIGPDAEPRTGDEQAIPDVALVYLETSGLIETESSADTEVARVSGLGGSQLAIGSWEWTPPLIVTEITRQVLENAGYEVTFVQDEFVRDGVTSGTVDLYWDYTGSGITLWHGIPSRGVPQDPELVWEMIGELDGLHHDLTWLRPSSIDEAWVLMVKPELYEAGMTTIDDLADHVRSNGADSLVLCVEDDFYSSTTDGLPALFRFYDFELAESNINVVSYDELYEGLRAGECDVAEAFPDDGRLLVWNLPTLEDTRNFFVPFNLAPVIRNDTLAQHPELQGLLEQISTLIDVPTIQQLSALVDIGPDAEPRTGDEQAIPGVALVYLKQAGLIPKPQLVVASASAPEQMILGKLLVLLLQSANFPVVDKTGMEDSVAVRTAMENGEVDLFIDFSGDLLVEQHGLPLVALPEDPDKTHVLASSLDSRRNMVWLNRGNFSNWPAVIARQELAELGVTTVEDLGRYITESADTLTLCTDADFFGDKVSGLLAMQDKYGFTFDLDRALLMESDQIYEALRNGDCNVGIGDSTDGRMAAWNIVHLSDTLGFFPFNNPAPVVRQTILDENPELEMLLNGLMATLSEDAIRTLNAQVMVGQDGVEASGDESAPDVVAQDYLNSIGLQLNSGANAADNSTPQEEGSPPDGEAAPDAGEQSEDAEAVNSEAPAVAGASDVQEEVNYDGAELLREALALVVELGRSGQLQSPQLTVGSKSSTEQMLLGQMMILMLEDIGYRVNDRTGLGYSQLVRDALRNGEIDMYMELTGTALASYHNLPLSALPGDPEQAFNLAKRMDESRGLIWLPEARANDTDTLIVRQELADQGVQTIEDIGPYVDENNVVLTLCVEQEFAQRQVKGLDDLLNVYGLTFEPDNVLVAGLNETYDALRNGACDIAQGIGTDGRISAWGLVSLEDTLQFFPSYTPAPVVRSDVLEENPGLAPYLGQLGEFLDNSAMRQLNALVELGDDGVPASGDEQEIRQVATDFLCERRVITNCAADLVVSPEQAAANDAAALDPTGETGAEPVATPAENSEEDSGEAVAEGADEATSAAEVQAEEVQPTILITIPSAYGVNARQAPSTSAPVVQVLTRGSTATAVGRLESGAWLQISLAEDLTAWVFAGAVLYLPEELEILPVVAP